jgi:hypothetical protein
MPIELFQARYMRAVAGEVRAVAGEVSALSPFDPQFSYITAGIYDPRI